jgi:hypothetical protein
MSLPKAVAGERQERVRKRRFAWIELHSVNGIRRALASDLDVGNPIQGKTPINFLIEMYTRSDRFPECLHLLLERGAILDDPKLMPVLLNDDMALGAAPFE